MLPKKFDIMQRATAMSITRQIKAGLPSITPEESEMKESGIYREAQEDLMTTNAQAFSDQLKYLSDMAGEMRLKVIPFKELGELKRETGYEWTDGWHKPSRRHEQIMRRGIAPKPIIPPILQVARVFALPKLNPRQPRRHFRHHTQRTSKTMRSLRHVKGKRAYSFPDSIWKVRR